MSVTEGQRRELDHKIKTGQIDPYAVQELLDHGDPAPPE